MKVLFYCYTFYPVNTGYSNAFQNFVKSITSVDENCFIDVLTPESISSKDEIKIKNVSIVRVKKKYNFLGKIGQIFDEISCAKKLNSLVKDNEYDAVFVETVDQVFFLNSLSSECLKKLIVRIHATNETELTFFKRSIQHRIRKFFLSNILPRKIKYFCATNKYHLDFIKKYFFKGNEVDIADSNFYVVPNSINNTFNPSKNEQDKYKIFTLGRMDYIGNNQKGFLDFISALNLIDKETLNKFEITIVGDGDMYDFVKMSLKNFKNVKLIKSMSHDEVISTLIENDIVVLLSRYEGLSMFALESLSTGNACIFTDAGALNDLIDDNGVLVERQNIDEICAALNKMSKIKRPELERMKENSINLVNKNYSDLAVYNKFKNLITLVKSNL